MPNHGPTSEPPSGGASGDFEITARLEQVLADRLACLLAATPSTLDAEIVATQREICVLLGMDRSAIWQGTAIAPQTLKLTHLCTLDTIPPVPEGITANAAFPWFTRQLLAGQTVAVPDVALLPEEASADRASLIYYKDKSTLAIPFVKRPGFVAGAISFAATSRHEAWPAALLAHCRLAAQIIGSVLARAHADAALAATEARSCSLLEHLNLGVFLSSAKGPIQHANSSLVRMAGFQFLDEILALPRGGLWANLDERERFLDLIAHHGSVRDFETLLLRKDGSALPVSVNAAVLADRPDQAEQVLGTIEDITERKARQQALHESEQKFASAFHGSTASFAIATWPEGHFLDVNEPLLRTLGYSRDELIGRTFAEIGAWVVPEQAEEYRERLTREGRVVGFQTTFRRKSGDIGYGLVSSTRIDVGGSACLLAETIDITERVLAEAALKESEARFRTAFEQAFVGIAYVDQSGRFQRVNRRMCDLLGYPREELLRLDVQSITHPDDRETTFESFRRLNAGEIRELTSEKRYLRKDGGVVWGSVVVTLLHDDRGERQGFAAYLQDITRRKDAEWQLEMVKSSIDHAPAAVIWLDGTGKVVYGNETACQQLGYSHEEFLRLHVRDFSTTATVTRWPEVFETTKAKGSLHLETMHRRKDGTALPVEVHSWYFRHDDSEYILGFITDVTEKLAAERERTGLRQQLDRAQRLESVGRLAGGVAHDFNNLLSIIQMSAHLAGEDVEPSRPLHGYLSEIRTAASRSAELTRQLLAFARKQTIAPRVLDLNAAIEGLLKMLRRLLGENLELAWLPGWELWPVLMDPAQVDQLLANLCVNARDAIADVGKVEIETSNLHIDVEICAKHPGFLPGDFVALSIRDNGCGMDAETQAHIFEPFFTTKGEGKGTGLGLATVYGIVTQNNGFLDVSSSPGQGATFTVFLPRQQGTGHHDEAEPSRTPRPGHESILVVEDDPTVLDLVTRGLGRLGYAILPTHAPGEALGVARARNVPLDLILTDVIMPEMNGRELAGRLQELHPEARCLFMSGYSADIIAPHGVLEPGIRLIAKPFTVEELAFRVREVLDSPRES